MSEENTDENDEESELRERINNFILRNFPQIQMHGGESAITEVDVDEGYVKIQLGGACSGCGVSPMTTQAIKKKLPSQINEISSVSVATGGDSISSMGLPDGSMRKDVDEEQEDQINDDVPDAPF